MNKRRLLTFILMMVSSIFFYASASGQTRQSDIAEISNNGSSVSWAIRVPYESGTLTVSTPNGEVIRREFKAGSIPTFSPTSERGEFYGNGRYTFEIVLTPILSKETRTTMALSRGSGNSTEVAEDLRNRGLLPPETITSGTFTFQDGTLFTARDAGNRNLAEPGGKGGEPGKDDGGRDTDIPVDGDQQILDDLIVDGSICAGLDCVNGESFGFDTLRLKENNLRIRFFDTSTSASFPTNDWELTANDSSNGGANRFSITDIDNGKVPFTITANAPSNSLFVNSAGRVGLRTGTPVVELHIADGDTPTVRLEQNGSSGFTPQTWDIAGNETNFFIRDVSNGSKLPFRIRPGALGSSIDIQNDGTVRIENRLAFKDGSIYVPFNPLVGANAASYFVGASGQVVPADFANATVDLNTNGLGPTPGVAATVNARYNVPTTGNLADTSLGFMEYTIRYLDSDGTSNVDARVRLTVLSVDVTTGANSSALVFDSNNNGSTVENTAVVCQAVPANTFDFGNNRGTFLSAVIQNKTTTGLSQVVMIRLLRKSAC